MAARWQCTPPLAQIAEIVRSDRFSRLKIEIGTQILTPGYNAQNNIFQHKKHRITHSQVDLFDEVSQSLTCRHVVYKIPKDPNVNQSFPDIFALVYGLLKIVLESQEDTIRAEAYLEFSYEYD